MLEQKEKARKMRELKKYGKKVIYMCGDVLLVLPPYPTPYPHPPMLQNV